MRKNKNFQLFLMLATTFLFSVSNTIAEQLKYSCDIADYNGVKLEFQNMTLVINQELDEDSDEGENAILEYEYRQLGASDWAYFIGASEIYKKDGSEISIRWHVITKNTAILTEEANGDLNGYAQFQNVSRTVDLVCKKL